MFTTTSNIQNSILTQTGTTAINIAGALNLPARGTATTSGGFNSQPQDFVASVFNGTAAVPQTFQWQAEPLNKGQSTATGTLNLLFASGTRTPAETGLSVSNKGIITFAAGQTLPLVTGNESVTGNVSATGQLISTVATGTAPLAVTSTTMVKNLNSTLLGGLSSSAFAQLTAPNTFTKTQTINANLALPQTTSASAGVITIAGASFLHGFGDTSNAFVGPLAGGGFETTGFSDTGVGHNALFANTSGTNNTAAGECALCNSTTGVQNTALGALSGFNISTGSNNTLIGYSAGTNGVGTLINATAIGANAQVGSSNALVLGGTGANAVNVGIGTPVPLSLLDVAGQQHTLIGNPGCAGPSGAIGFGVGALADCNHYSLLGEGFSTYLDRPAGGVIFFREGNNTEMMLASGGNLGIGTTAPSYLLHVNGTMRAETGLSMGGYAVLSVDAPGIPGGQFQVKNGTVSIGGDTPMSSNPHMSFSGMFFGSLCVTFIPCGGAQGYGWGGFVPDKNILITHVTTTLNTVIDPSCLPGWIEVQAPGVGVFSNLIRVPLQANSTYVDSGPVTPPVPIAAGTQLRIWAELENPNNCKAGTSAGGNLFMNVQYVMQ